MPYHKKFFRLVNGMSNITFPNGYGIRLANYSYTLCENEKNENPYREYFQGNVGGEYPKEEIRYATWYGTDNVEVVVKNPEGNWITDQIFKNCIGGKLGYVTPSEYSVIFAIVQTIDDKREIIPNCMLDRDYERMDKACDELEDRIRGRSEIQPQNTDRFAMLEHISIADTEEG